MRTSEARILADIALVRHAEAQATAETLARYGTGRFSDAIPAAQHADATAYQARRVDEILAELRAAKAASEAA